MDKIQTALDIIDTFDWGWRMEDSNYNENMAKAKNRTRHFTETLKEISDKAIVKALREIWIAYYDLSQPFMDKDYYKKKNQALDDTKNKLSELLNKQ